MLLNFLMPWAGLPAECMPWVSWAPQGVNWFSVSVTDTIPAQWPLKGRREEQEAEMKWGWSLKHLVQQFHHDSEHPFIRPLETMRTFKVKTCSQKKKVSVKWAVAIRLTRFGFKRRVSVQRMRRQLVSEAVFTHKLESWNVLEGSGSFSTRVQGQTSPELQPMRRNVMLACVCWWDVCRYMQDSSGIPVIGTIL